MNTDPLSILQADDEYKATVMLGILYQDSRMFVDTVFRPFISFSLQYPRSSCLPQVLKRFMREVEDSRTRSLVRIAIDELHTVLTKCPYDEKEKISAVETFLMICPYIESEDVGALSAVLGQVEWKKPMKKFLLKLIHESNIVEDAKREYFLNAMQLESMSDLREQALVYMTSRNIANSATLHAISHQLRDKSKKVQQLALKSLLRIDPKHLGPDMLARTLGILSHILETSAENEENYQALSSLLVVYCTWPSHTLELTCERLIKLEQYETALLRDLIQKNISQLACPSFFH